MYFFFNFNILHLSIKNLPDEKDISFKQPFLSIYAFIFH